MAKKKKVVEPVQDNTVSEVPEFEFVSVEESGPLMAAGDMLEELRESEEVEEVQETEEEEPVRMKVTVVRAYVFSLPDLLSRSVCAVSFGNIVMRTESENFSDKFFKIRVPRQNGSVNGYILKTKVKRI